jgi:hypothetical protein
MSLQFDHTNTANGLAEVLVLLTTAKGRLNVLDILILLRSV